MESEEPIQGCPQNRDPPSFHQIRVKADASIPSPILVQSSPDKGMVASAFNRWVPHDFSPEVCGPDCLGDRKYWRLSGTTGESWTIQLQAFVSHARGGQEDRGMWFWLNRVRHVRGAAQHVQRGKSERVGQSWLE